MIKFKNILNNLISEGSQQTYDYGCVMVYYKFPEIKKVHSQILNKDVYVNPDDTTFGLETEPHITLLYGLHEGVSTSQVRDVVENFEIEDVIIYKPSLFKNEKYDVLKFDVRYDKKKNPYLSKINHQLKKFPYTSNFPHYTPHLTIAYLKPGEGEKYVNKFKELEYKIEPLYIVYSHPNGNKDKIKIK